MYAAIQKIGYAGTFSGVRTYIESIRKDRKNNISREKTLSIARRKVCLWMWGFLGELEADEKIYLHRVFEDYPELKFVYKCIQSFRNVIKNCDVEGLIMWLKDQLTSKIQPFYYYAVRLRSDIQSVKNALIQPFSNGLLEGQVNRLKSIKRMTYGRAGLLVLEKRVLYRL
ncbi:transposase [Sporosarcina sp. E16_3]|nr:transposase [Sporosarcina sp. E16_8]MBO0603624.1 transposase [Sporosarcina sp. E16_3]